MEKIKEINIPPFDKPITASKSEVFRDMSGKVYCSSSELRLKYIPGFESEEITLIFSRVHWYAFSEPYCINIDTGFENGLVEVVNSKKITELENIYIDRALSKNLKGFFGFKHFRFFTEEMGLLELVCKEMSIHKASL